MKHRFTGRATEDVHGGRSAFALGEAFEYTDTGYILLGAMLENVTGKSMGAATRELVGFDGLGLTETRWEKPQPKSLLARAHQYDRHGRGINNEDSLFDLLGGGGIVSTPKNLARFFYALFHGQVFMKPETIHVMLLADNTVTPRKGSPYGYGVRIYKVGDLTVYEHGGVDGRWRLPSRSWICR